MEISVMGYIRQVNIDYLSGLDEIHRESIRIVREDNLEESAVFYVFQTIQATRFEYYQKDFDL